MRDVRLILQLLTPREKRHGLLVMLVMLGVAGFETLGVASILPFLTVLSNPGLVETNPMLQWLFTTARSMGIETLDGFLMLLGGLMFGAILLSSVYRAVALYVVSRYVEMRRHGFSERLLHVYLSQPYAFFLNRHSGDLSKTVLSEADQVSSNVVGGVMRFLVNVFVAVAIAVLLVLINPWMALAVAVVIGGLYGGIFFGIKRLLERLGDRRLQANEERYTATGEVLSGIKVVKVLGVESAYMERFRGPSRRYSRSQITALTLGMVPQYMVEVLLFGGVVLLTLVLLQLSGGVEQGALAAMLPMIGVYAFAAARLKPAAQNAFKALSDVRFGRASLQKFHADLSMVGEDDANDGGVAGSGLPLPVRRDIALRELEFRYPGAAEPALKDIDIVIPKGSSLGIVGGTGAGKTTLVDVLLGLLRPTSGRIDVDGVEVCNQRIRSWQRTIGYVPQEIFLADDTVAANIALGVDRASIDMTRVQQCGRMAQLHDFVMTNLEQGYETRVGERGLRLSGGQRQRIGIARALYRNPEVLVFDEATSALDTLTERAVMEAIENLSNEKTVILIAHRLSTVRRCDRIVLLEQGRVADIGSYDALLSRSQRFQAMVEA